MLSLPLLALRLECTLTFGSKCRNLYVHSFAYLAFPFEIVSHTNLIFYILHISSFWDVPLNYENEGFWRNYGTSAIFVKIFEKLMWDFHCISCLYAGNFTEKWINIWFIRTITCHCLAFVKESYHFLKDKTLPLLMWPS